MPSLRPLSTLSPWRTRAATRGSVTTACPSAASVGARITPTITASPRVNWRKTTPATSAPSAMVRGRPMPRSRAGRPNSARSALKSMRDASQKRTRASVASASVRTTEPVLSSSTPPSTWGPTTRPIATNTIVGVTGAPTGVVRQRRRQAARAPRLRATNASGEGSWQVSRAVESATHQSAAFPHSPSATAPMSPPGLRGDISSVGRHR